MDAIPLLQLEHTQLSLTGLLLDSGELRDERNRGSVECFGCSMPFLLLSFLVLLLINSSIPSFLALLYFSLMEKISHIKRLE